MPDNQIMFRVLLRRPIYPVIVISADRLRTAHDMKTLAVACLRSMPLQGEKRVAIIDAAAMPFEYDPETVSVMPRLYPMKPWSKKDMIDCYNTSANARETGEHSSDRSLGNKSVSRVSADLCDLIKRSNQGK